MTKIRIRLKKEETETLGLDWKGKEKGNRNPKYTITTEQLSQIRDFKPKEVKDYNFGTTTDTSTSDYPSGNEGVTLNAWNHKTGKVMTLEEYCEEYSININHVTSYKRVDYQGTPTYNVACHVDRDIKEILDVDFIEKIVKENVEKIKMPNLYRMDPVPTTYVDRLMFSDVHIGMDVDPEGIAPYGFKWNEDEIMHRLSLMVNWLIQNKKGSILIIDNFGDFLDGQDKQTVRGGHELPQNMNNREAYTVGYKFYLGLIDALAPEYDSIIINNICNDNHSGDFAWYCFEAIRLALVERYDHVDINNIIKFFDHYEIFNHIKVVSHGKDKKVNKYGMKIKPDKKENEKIDSYLKHHNLYNGKKIEFSKGDNHLSLRDETNGDFDYNNLPAFSPASEYVQENYSKGRSGFQIQHMNSANTQMTFSPYWF